MVYSRPGVFSVRYVSEEELGDGVDGHEIGICFMNLASTWVEIAIILEWVGMVTHRITQDAIRSEWEQISEPGFRYFGSSSIIHQSGVA